MPAGPAAWVRDQGNEADAGARVGSQPSPSVTAVTRLLRALTVVLGILVAFVVFR